MLPPLLDLRAATPCSRDINVATSHQAVEGRLLTTGSRRSEDSQQGGWLDRITPPAPAPAIFFRSVADKEGRNREKHVSRDTLLRDQRSSSMKWSKFDVSHYLTPSAAFLLLKSISLMLPNWMDCDGRKLPYVHINGEGCRLWLMHVKQSRWCYALNSNTNWASVKYPFQSSGASPQPLNTRLKYRSIYIHFVVFFVVVFFK